MNYGNIRRGINGLIWVKAKYSITFIFLNTFNVIIIQNHFVDEKESYNLVEFIFDIL